MKDHPEMQARFDRVAKLINRVETPFDLELLTTVHCTTPKEKAADVSDAGAKVFHWNDRKLMFKEQHIHLA